MSGLFGVQEDIMEIFFVSASSSIQRLQVGFHEGVSQAFELLDTLDFTFVRIK